MSEAPPAGPPDEPSGDQPKPRPRCPYCGTASGDHTKECPVRALAEAMRSSRAMQKAFKDIQFTMPRLTLPPVYQVRVSDDLLRTLNPNFSLWARQSFKQKPPRLEEAAEVEPPAAEIDVEGAEEVAEDAPDNGTTTVDIAPAGTLSALVQQAEKAYDEQCRQTEMLKFMTELAADAANEARTDRRIAWLIVSLTIIGLVLAWRGPQIRIEIPVPPTATPAPVLSAPSLTPDPAARSRSSEHPVRSHP